MPRWLFLCACCYCASCVSGCAVPIGKGLLLRESSSTAKKTSSEQSTNAPAGPPTSTASSLSTVTRLDSPEKGISSLDASVSVNPASLSPSSVLDRAGAANGNTSEWNEIEQALARDPSKLTPELKHYLREQVFAILASHSEATPANHSLVREKLSTDVLHSTPVHSELPGPDSDPGAPIIDEDSFRLSNLPRPESGPLPETEQARATTVKRADYIVSEEAAQRSLNRRSPVAEVAVKPRSLNSETSPALEPDLQPGQWRASLDQTLQLLEKELAGSPRQESDGANLAACLRMLHALANHRGEAVAAIEQLPEDEQEYWKHQMHALLLALNADEKHAPSRRAALVLRELRSAQDHLSKLSALDVRNLAFCKAVDSYGCYTEFPTQTFRPEQEIVLYAEIDNFDVEKVNDKYETELQFSYDILDSSGARVANVALPVDKNRCDNHRRDYFITYTFYLPKDIRPGSYTLQLTVEDLKGHKSNQGSLEFRVR